MAKDYDIQATFDRVLEEREKIFTEKLDLQKERYETEVSKKDTEITSLKAEIEVLKTKKTKSVIDDETQTGDDTDQDENNATIDDIIKSTESEILTQMKGE